MNFFDSVKYGFQGLGTLVNPFDWNGHASADAVNLQALSGDVASSVYSDSQALWDREDSAYQRMVADMQKAGLNPWTGISSGGLSAGSNIPALDSLTGLLQTLSSSFEAQKVANDTFGTYSDFGYKIGSLATKVVNSISSIVSAVA